MESDSRPAPSTPAELRERAAIINRARLTPHQDGSGLSWWVVLGASVLNTASAWLLFLIVREEALPLLWVLLLLPLAAPLGWSVASWAVRHRYGVAPSRNNRPRELARFEYRAVILSMPLELAILVLVLFAPVGVALSVAFVASLLTFTLIWRSYERAAARIGSRSE